MAILLASSLALTACAQSVRVDPPVTATANTQVLPTTAMVTPPPGGPQVIGVIQSTASNAVTQEIALSTQSTTRGQNAIYARIYRGDSVGGTGEIRDRELRPEELRKEMNSRMPGVRMQVSLFYVQNKYGPFGYAIGRSRTGDLCMYGWQRIVPNKPPGPWFGPPGSISIRLRICDAKASEAALLSLMYGYTINAYFLNPSWNPYGPPPDVPANIGQIDSPMSPVGQTGLGSVLNGELGPPALPSAPVVRTSAPSRYTGRRVYSDVAADPYGAGQPSPYGAGGQSSYPVSQGYGGGYGAVGGYEAAQQGGYSSTYQSNIPSSVPTPQSGYPVVPQPGSGRGGR